MRSRNGVAAAVVLRWWRQWMTRRPTPLVPAAQTAPPLQNTEQRQHQIDNAAKRDQLNNGEREKKTGRVISRRQWEPREKRKRRGEQLNRARNAAEIEMKKKKKALQRKKAPALSWYGLIIETQLAVQPPPPPEWTYLDRGLSREIKDRERGTTVWNRSETDLVLKMWSKQAAEHHLQLCLTFC